MREGLQFALDFASKASKGVPWTIPEEWAQELMKENNLTLTQRHYNMTGETSVLFDYNGETIRLERTWTKQYRLFHGDWEPDPHWTGD